VRKAGRIAAKPLSTNAEQDQAEAVAQWRRVILSVAVEEMGHLAIVNNLLVAIGGAPHFNRPNLPVAEGYMPACFTVRLTPFDEAALDHFIFLEHPEGSSVQDHDTFGAEAEVVREVKEIRLTPSAEDYETIAELYGMIREDLQSLAARQGSLAFIAASGARQIGPDVVDLPGVRVITDLPTALQALNVIVEQGEGSPHELEDSHFARFNAIKSEWAELKASNPAFKPAHPVAHDPVMRCPTDSTSRVWIMAPEAVRHLDLANAIYGQVLILLEEVYAPSMCATDRRAFFQAAMSLMQTLSLLGHKLARMPASPGHPGVMAGLTFTVPRNLGARGPGSAELILERLGELSEGYKDVAADEGTSPIQQAYQQLEKQILHRR
ncbi:ferritin-like domain-containing protein, partial [Microvirga aerilata]